VRPASDTKSVKPMVVMICCGCSSKNQGCYVDELTQVHLDFSKVSNPRFYRSAKAWEGIRAKRDYPLDRRHPRASLGRKNFGPRIRDHLGWLPGQPLKFRGQATE
jgi:hypothetical protein